MTSANRAAFTLVEMLVVAAIVLILAGIVVPSFTDSVDDATAASVRQELGRIRTASEYYTFRHLEARPGLDPSAGLWTEAAFLNQLTMATNLDGEWAVVGTAGYPYGPYLTEQFPANPYNDLSTVMVIPPGGVFSAPDDSTGWVYYADSGVFRANTSEYTPTGELVFDL